MNAPHWYECTRGRESRAPFTGTLYRCQGCDGLLDVEHNLETLMTRPADVWKNLFDDRATSCEWPYQSGVWSKHEWVHPRIEIENIVSLGEGNSPLVRLTQLAKHLGVSNLWLKDIGSGPTGSFQDLGMTVLVSSANQLIMAGQPIRALACATTGDAASSLAAYCAAAEIPSVLFFPVGESSTAQQAQPLAHGARVVVLDTDLDGCERVAHQVAADHSIRIVNPMSSLSLQGQKTVAVELVQQLVWSVPDWIIVPSRNLEITTALGRGFLVMKELGLVNCLPRIACVCEEESDPFHRSNLSGFMCGESITVHWNPSNSIEIEDSVSRERAAKLLCAFDGVVEQIDREDLASAAAMVGRAESECSPQTVKALTALSGLVHRGEVRATDRVVVIAVGQESNASLHDRSSKDAPPCLANAAVELPADSKAVAAWITHVLDQREETYGHHAFSG